MDPRMDTGMEYEKRPELDVHKPISPEQTLYVMDRLVTLEMAWIAGFPLPQTAYTCIYLHRVKELIEMQMPTVESSVTDVVFGALRSYILATAKCCHYIHREMSNRNIYDQEDFIMNLYGITLDHQYPKRLIRDDIATSVFLLKNMIKTEAYDVTVLQEILFRVNMRNSYLLSLIYISQPKGAYITQATIELQKVAKILKKIDLTKSIEYKDAFDPNINRKLTSHTPPRSVELPTEERSFENYGMLIDRLLYICSAIEYPSICALMNQFNYFASKQPYADAFSRSKLSTLFYHEKRIFGTIPISQFMSASVKEIVQPPLWWLISNPRLAPHTINQSQFTKAHEILGIFFEKASLIFLNYFKICCHNRSRQRRLLNKVLPQWERFQSEAAGVDELFHRLQIDNQGELPYYFSSWAYHLKLLMMEKILFLGFELDLYGQNEYIMVYWYIQNVLLSQAYLLNRIHKFMDRSMDTSSEPSDYIHSTQLLNQAKLSLSEATMKSLIVAKCTKQFSLQPVVFDDEETRYMHRFKLFAKLHSPAHPPYDVYLSSVYQPDIEYMSQTIKHHLLNTKKTLETLVTMTPKETSTQLCHEDFIKELSSLLHTTVFNMNHIPNTTGTKVKVEFKYHCWFPLISQ